MRKKIKKIKLKFAEGEFMSIIEQLQTFVDNGGRMQTGVDLNTENHFMGPTLNKGWKKNSMSGIEYILKLNIVVKKEKNMIA